MDRRGRLRAPLGRFVAAALAAWPMCTAAQEGGPVAQEPVVVTATRGEVSAFDAPAAIGAVDASTIRSAGPQVNLSEALDRIPGISVLNRQNYAQDLQLSIRGFGARSTFGIRGVRVIVDGIPATMPDGQGQASSIVLPAASRIEVLRGPLALLYGNAAGGVVQVVSEAGAERPTLSLDAAFGPYDMSRYGAGFAGSSGVNRYSVNANRFSTDGYREHSAAERTQANAKWVWEPNADTRVSTVVNALDLEALDPLGLTRAQWQADPRQAPALALQQDSRKAVRQQQAGTVVERRIDADTRLSARFYAGERNLDNALSVPPAAQASPTSSGGIVSFDRVYAGAALQASRRAALGESSAATLLAEIDFDRMRDDRQGYLNVGGARGALKRDEDDTVANTDALLQATLDLGRSWSAIAGVRASRVRFDTADRYIAPGNPDDSGVLTYRATNPVAGITWHASPRLNVYANAGRGFETPTFTELAYRNDASGLNTELAASRSRQLEVGAKWRASDRQRLEVALYDIRTENEIVVDRNAGGRSTFRNAGHTTRRGIELSYVGWIAPEWRATAALSALRARFDDPFASGSGDAAVPVARGNRLPGTPERNAFVELLYAPHAMPGLQAALEAVHVGRLYVNDANSDFAPAATLLNLRVGWRWRLGGMEVEPLLRLENATDRRYAGSVIVNEANGRYFEPAPPRTWMFSVSVREAI
ncbi:MAG TPA: TonB-dependent receptor [Usitatibacter sp.]|nr:TonB-dependent receptor [Usitatibacter sp.]